MNVDTNDIIAQYVFLKTSGLKNDTKDFEKSSSEIDMLEKQALFLMYKNAQNPGKAWFAEALAKLLSGSLGFVAGVGTKGLDLLLGTGELASDVFLQKLPAMALGGGALGGGLWWLMNKQRMAREAKQKARLSEINREIAKYTPGYRPVKGIYDA